MLSPFLRTFSQPFLSSIFVIRFGVSYLISGSWNSLLSGRNRFVENVKLFIRKLKIHFFNILSKELYFQSQSVFLSQLNSFNLWGTLKEIWFYDVVINNIFCFGKIPKFFKRCPVYCVYMKLYENFLKQFDINWL